MAADHVGLIHMLDEIRSMERRFRPLSRGAPAPSPAERRLAAEELRQKVAHMAAELREHLEEEERFFTPVIREKFTKEEYQQVRSFGRTGEAYHVGNVVFWRPRSVSIAYESAIRVS